MSTLLLLTLFVSSTCGVAFFVANSRETTNSQFWYPWARASAQKGKSISTAHVCRSVVPLLGTMKSANKLESVLYMVDEVMDKQLVGDLVEAGVAQGGGVLPVIFYLACAGGLPNRSVYLFDTWEGLPPAAAEQDKGFHEGAFHVTFDKFMMNVEDYRKAYKAKVLTNPVLAKVAMASWDDVWSHVEIVKGLFADTMPGALEHRQLAMLMCDGDMYASTKDCMISAGPKVVKGGGIYNDDYYAFRGCYDAVQEYVQGTQNNTVFLVPQQEDFKLLPEKTSMCVPPTDNSRKSGTCESLRVEASIFFASA